MRSSLEPVAAERWNYREKTGTSVQNLFDRISPRYDLFNRCVSLFLDGAWRRAAASLVEPGSQRVLDVCTGTGDLAFALSRRLRGKGEVVGIDFSTEMLVLAEAKVKRGRLASPPRFLFGDAQALPFASEDFDAVTSGFSMRNLTDLGKGLREMCRVLKPGGRVIILEFNRPSRGVGEWITRFYLRFWIPLIGFLTCGTVGPFLYLRESVLSFLPPAGFCRALSEAGFKEATYRVLPPGAIVLYSATK